MIDPDDGREWDSVKEAEAAVSAEWLRMIDGRKAEIRDRQRLLDNQLQRLGVGGIAGARRRGRPRSVWEYVGKQASTVDRFIQWLTVDATRAELVEFTGMLDALDDRELAQVIRSTIARRLAGMAPDDARELHMDGVE